MNFSFTIDGLDAVKRSSASIQQEVARQLDIAVLSAAREVHKEAVKSLKARKTGRIYTHYLAMNKKTGGLFPTAKRDKPHQASAAGEAPATDTGALSNSLSFYNFKGRAEAIVLTRLKYAPMLEFGTQKIVPRPFMFPAYEKSRAWITERLKKALADGIAKGAKQ